MTSSPSDSGNQRGDDRRQKLRNKIQASIESAQEEQRRELMRHRISVAKDGLKAFDNKRYQEAVLKFLTYIRILEDWKEVPPNGLHPSHFPNKSDLAEILLINSVYWHLVKLFDNQNGKQFSQYLDKFILFTRGQPFQPLTAETLRKFIRTKGLKHRRDLQNAYKMITGSKCFIATELMVEIDDPTLGLLRQWRDERLLRSTLGRTAVALYYGLAPSAAAILRRCPEFVRRGVARVLDAVARSQQS